MWIAVNDLRNAIKIEVLKHEMKCEFRKQRKQVTICLWHLKHTPGKKER